MEFRLKDYNLDDTIAAIATFPSKSALGIIKISGKHAIDVISKIFLPRKKKNLKKVKTYTLHYGWIINSYQSSVISSQPKKRTTNIVDEVLISVMRNPYSYTREDVVEISSHGGTFVLNKILELVLKEGARLALPGEFTYRALVKGRIDLLQAQSILNIIETRSETGLNIAVSQLKGHLSDTIKGLKEEIKEMFVQTEALINFPEDEVDVTFAPMKKNIKNIEKVINRLLLGSRQAKVFKEGMRCVICGKTNAGKSTLFNLLLKEERVIVSRFPGTTRDVIEETINIKGVPLRIYDTAGILEPKDFVTRKAVEKTSKVFDEADLVILVVDGSKALNKDDLFLLKKAKDKNTIIIINKIDIKQKLKIRDLPPIKGTKVKISALKNIGIKDLEEAIYKIVYNKGIDRANLIFLNQYQQSILEKARDSIKEAAGFLRQGYTIDFVNLALKESLENLGKLSGEVVSEEILESIFSNFCIGK
jgi:tRNA modification GTPase